ncbi:Hypothetical_protein [Hexamita inflata]|uniref:Hypothetical_protein n=1 Tax=Hexamita inflata TaxID=28002 RepID=A0AA86TRD9_9EUKA|nr:Hypothetical protein HINF_LOCUS13125 [Hexamita inflata]
MQTIIRENGYDGTDPETGGRADKNLAETAFVRLALHQQYFQIFVGTNWHTKVSKNFFVDCDMCYGFGIGGHIIYPGLQTVIFLNCKFSQYESQAMPNHNGTHPKIHIETIDDSCRQFTAAEKAAGRSVTELTIKVLCEQLKLIKIPETEKLELIFAFITRRGAQNGIKDEEAITALENFGSTTDQILVVLIKSKLDFIGFAQKKGISVDQAITTMVNQGLTDDQILIILAKSKQDILTFAEKKGLSNEQVLLTLVKNNIDMSDFTQKKGISNDQVLVILVNNEVDVSDFAQKKGISNDQVLAILVKNNIASSFIKDKGITNDQVIIALAKNNIDFSDFMLKNNISNDQVLIILSKNGIDVSSFAQKQGISNEQVLLLLIKENLDYTGFAFRRGMKDEQILTTLMKNNLDYTQFATSKSISNEQILVALAKSDLDFQTFAQSKGFTDEQTLITLMKAQIDIKPFLQSKKMSNEQIISIIQNSDLQLSDKYDLLQQITPVDLRSEQEDINNALIKREIEIVVDRVLKFVNNKQRELILEIVFKEALLKQKKNEDDSAVNEIAELKLKNQELQKLNHDIKLECEQKVANIKTEYEAELIKCKNEVESLRKEYQQDLQKEYEKYKNEIEELKKTNKVEKLTLNKSQDLEQKKLVSEQQIDINDSITNQLRMECKILKQYMQLIDEKQYHNDQQELILQLVNLSNQRNNDIQRQLTEEKTQRIIFFEDLQQKQSEITKQLEATVKEQASRIVHLENENQSLQSTLNALREQIEKLNVQEYQRRIDLQTKQLEDKDKYIEKLKEEMEKINVNQLQDTQIEKVLNILKSVSQ